MDSSARDAAEALLLRAGRAYGISVRQEDVQRALGDEQYGPAFTAWATVHLAEENLLTPDELALYTALDGSGQVDKLAALHDLAEVQAVTEDDTRIAIEELQKSTESISKQTHALRKQQDALSRLLKKGREAEARRRDLELSRQAKKETEQQRHSVEVEELSQRLQLRIADLEQQIDDADPRLAQTTDDVLRSDDRLLSSLQKLGWELEQQEPDEAEGVEKLREICMRLIKTTVETVRTRLDTVYLEALAAAQQANDNKTVTGVEIKALEEEVESLYSELLPVAQMSVEQQHLEPALKAVTARSGQGVTRSATAVIYVNDCLDHLLERISIVKRHVQTYKSHNAATASLVATAKDEISDPIPSTQKSTEPAMPASPVRISRTNARSGANRRSSGVPQEAPLDTLLQSLALPLQEEEVDGNGQVASLSEALAERSRKQGDVARNIHESFEAGAVSQLEDMRMAVQLLRDSLMAESSFGEVRLVDSEIEESIKVLGQEVDKAKEKLAAATDKRGSTKSDKKEDIIQRWGR